MCTPSTLPVSLLKRHLAMPLPSSSASALELALKDPTDLPRVKPSFSARALACSSVSPTMAISGCVKQAAGIASWSTSCDLCMYVQVSMHACMHAHVYIHHRYMHIHTCMHATYVHANIGRTRCTWTL